MREYIENKLIFDKKRGIWQLVDQESIPYSDGHSNEIYIKRVIQNARNLSSDSDELQNYIIDYTSQYHLSSKRSLLINGFNFNPTARVLEVGCGCGAITRFLGEVFNTVIAVEGSPRRAEIARLRTRDIDNVCILSAPLQEIKFTQKFDLIFCIGVLEYSSVFIKNDAPVDKMLSLLQGLLTDHGVLIIAIENQFGLKYFAGCPEDHTGICFEGIEGYPTFGANHAITFGRKEISQILVNNKFDTVTFYYPFPDYKFPQCILSQELFENKTGINPGELISNYSSHDNDRQRSTLFNQRLTWYELGKNHLIEDFSNSFLICAHNSKSLSHVSTAWLARFYNLDRSREYRTVTTMQHEKNTYKIYKKRLYRSDTISDKLNHSEETYSWENGKSLALLFEREINSPSFDVDRFVAILKPWIYLLTEGDEISGRTTIAGHAIDKMPWNIIVKNSSYSLIDQEWEWKTPLTLKFCVTRGIYLLLLRCNTKDNLSKHFKGKKIDTVVKTICYSIFPDYTDKDFKDFLATESEFQSIVYGKLHSHTLVSIKSSLSFRLGSSDKYHGFISFTARLRAKAKKYLIWISECFPGK